MPGRAPHAGRCSTTRPRPSWPRSAPGSRRTTAPRRTSSGRAPDGRLLRGAGPADHRAARADRPTRRPTGRCPTRTAFYFRASIVEQLPDPLTPLFADLIDGSVTRSLQRADSPSCSAATCSTPGDVGLPTINGYAYYRYGRGAMRRMIVERRRAAIAAARPARASTVRQARWRDRSHPRYVAAVDGWRRRRWPSCPTRELLDGVIELLDAGTEYYTAVQTIIPLAATSEVAFTGFYDRLVRRAGRPAGRRPSCSASTACRSGPRSRCTTWPRWTREHPELAAALPADAVGRAGRAAARRQAAGRRRPAGCGRSWRARFQRHLDRYGHTVYNLDFANPVPADDPAPLLDTLRFYLRGEGTDPNAAAGRLGRPAATGTPRRAGPARPGAAGGVRPAAALGAGHRPGPRGRAGRHRPGLAAAAPDAAGAGAAAGRRRRSSTARRTCSGCAATSCSAAIAADRPRPTAARAPKAGCGAGRARATAAAAAARARLAPGVRPD